MIRLPYMLALYTIFFIPLTIFFVLIKMQLKGISEKSSKVDKNRQIENEFENETY